jgi:hypothetical protein
MILRETSMDHPGGTVARAWFLIPFLLCLGGCGWFHKNTPKVDPQTAALSATALRYRERILGVLPEGWNVGFNGTMLLVHRIEPIEMILRVPGAAEDDDVPTFSQRRPYVLTLKFVPAMDATEYQRQAAVNAKTEEALEPYRARIEHLPHDQDIYAAAADQDKQLVLAYRDAQKRLPYYTLPNLFAADCAVVEENSMAGANVAFSQPVDENAMIECNLVKARIEMLFSPLPMEAATLP